MLPRMLWLNKNWTMQQVHFEVFKYMKHAITEWVDWTDPETTRVPKRGHPNLSDVLIDFPHLKAGDVKMTKADFEALSDEDAFKLCCSGIINCDDIKHDEPKFDITKQPYTLSFKKARAYGN